jgi:hypothetical protein
MVAKAVADVEAFESSCTTWRGTQVKVRSKKFLLEYVGSGVPLSRTFSSCFS